MDIFKSKSSEEVTKVEDKKEPEFTDEQQKRLEELVEERALKAKQERLRQFAKLPPAFREKLLENTKARLVMEEIMYDRVPNNCRSSTEEDRLHSQYAEKHGHRYYMPEIIDEERHYGEQEFILSEGNNNVPKIDGPWVNTNMVSYEELEKVHIDASARNILLDDNEE